MKAHHAGVAQGLGGAVVILVLSLAGVWAAPKTRAPEVIVGNWLGSWRSSQSPAAGRFSALLSAEPAWWGGVEIVGTIQFVGKPCAGRLAASGSYYRGHEYLLTATGPDGTVRVTSAVTVTDRPRKSLSGHYDVVPSGTGCSADSGRLDANLR